MSLRSGGVAAVREPAACVLDGNSLDGRAHGGLQALDRTCRARAQLVFQLAPAEFERVALGAVALQKQQPAPCATKS